MRRIRRANYRKPKKLTKKVLEARMQDIMNEPTPEDEVRFEQMKERVYTEYLRREKAKTPQVGGTWILDGESRKKEVAKQLAEWNTEDR